MIFLNFALAVLSLLSPLALASPALIGSSCPALLVDIIRLDPQATPFCSTFLHIATATSVSTRLTTSSVVLTVTHTINPLVTVVTSTRTLTSVITTTTGTVTVAVETDTTQTTATATDSVFSTTLVIVADYPTTAVGFRRRAMKTPNCFINSAEVVISSLCRCLSIHTPTVTSTTIATPIQSLTMTATITSTVTVDINTATTVTQYISTLLVIPTTLSTTVVTTATTTTDEPEVTATTTYIPPQCTNLFDGTHLGSPHTGLRGDEYSITDFDAEFAPGQTFPTTTDYERCCARCYAAVSCYAYNVEAAGSCSIRQLILVDSDETDIDPSETSDMCPLGTTSDYITLFVTALTPPRIVYGLGPCTENTFGM